MLDKTNYNYRILTPIAGADDVVLLPELKSSELMDTQAVTYLVDLNGLTGTKVIFIAEAVSNVQGFDNTAEAPAEAVWEELPLIATGDETVVDLANLKDDTTALIKAIGLVGLLGYSHVRAKIVGKLAVDTVTGTPANVWLQTQSSRSVNNNVVTKKA